jgi:integrase
MRLHDITPRECERIIAKKRRESSSPVRANRWLTVLRSVFKSAVEWELVVRDPTRKLRKVKEPRREIILTPNDLDRILEQSDDWMKPIILTAYFTGPRRGDLLGEGKQYGGGRPLMWDDVDLDKCVISYRDTKEKEVRHVPANEELVVVLRGLSSRFEGKEVFLDAKGKPVSPERASTRFKAAAVRAGIPDASKIRFHDLRHTCGTTLIEMGVDIHAVREILGHHSVQMTERYLHADRGRLRAAVARLSGTLRAQPGTTAQNTTD